MLFMLDQNFVGYVLFLLGLLSFSAIPLRSVIHRSVSNQGLGFVLRSFYGRVSLPGLAIV